MHKERQQRRLVSILAGMVLLASLLTTVALDAPPAEAQSITTCSFARPEYPHLSSFAFDRGILEIKSSTSGECQPTTAPITITAQLTLQRAGGLFGFFSDVAVGPPIAKRIQGTFQTWRRNELVVVAPCVPGTYRARLEVSSRADGGIAFVLGGPSISNPIEIDCKPRRVSMVIDDTGSMAPVIAGVQSALTSFISGQPEDEYTSWSLTTFKDSPTFVGTTEDRAQALGWVNGLSASGGGDCPEDALGGISNGLAALGTDPDTDKQMLVATDASAQAGDVDGIIASARAAGVRVNVLLTGDCDDEGGGEFPSASAARTLQNQGPDLRPATDRVAPASLSSQVVLRRIAEETGGNYYFLPGGSVEDFTAALEEIFAIIGDTPVEPELSCAGVSGTAADLEAAGYNVILGTDGNDRLFGTPGNDVIIGYGGRDRIKGGAGDDVICGGDGNDVLDGGDGNDVLDGGDGVDVIVGGLGDDALFGGPGNDTIRGDNGNDVLDGGDDQDRLLGGAGNDEITGGAGNDVIDGGSGADTIDAGDGDDRVSAGSDNDTVLGGPGNDRLDGGSGNDSLNGGSGNDTLNGGPGNDTLNGDDDDDNLRGGPGVDSCDGGAQLVADIASTCETVIDVP